MNSYQLREKRQLQKTMEYRKNYIDPTYLLKQGTKDSLKTFIEWKHFFQGYINKSHPYGEYSKEELSEKDYYQYVKIVHLVGLHYEWTAYWFRNQAVHFLLKLYEKWKSLADRLNQEYFLAAWIFESDFLNSQVVFGLNSRISRYANMFDESSINRPMPFLSKDMQSKVPLLNMTYQKVIEGFSRDDLAEMSSRNLIQRCKEQIGRDSLSKININRSVHENMEYFIDNKILTEVQHHDEEPYYIAHIDNVWVLQKK